MVLLDVSSYVYKIGVHLIISLISVFLGSWGLFRSAAGALCDAHPGMEVASWSLDNSTFCFCLRLSSEYKSIFLPKKAKGNEVENEL